MMVQELKRELEKFPDNCKVIFCERGGVYDCDVDFVFISKWDKRHNRKTITLSNGRDDSY